MFEQKHKQNNIKRLGFVMEKLHKKHGKRMLKNVLLLC